MSVRVTLSLCINMQLNTDFPRWFTSMLGKLGSVSEVVGELRRRNVR